MPLDILMHIIRGSCPEIFASLTSCQQTDTSEGKIDRSLKMPLRTILALLIGHRVHRHGFIAPLEPTNCERV